MLKHYEVVHSLLRTALWGAERFPLCVEEDTDWTAVSRELSDHAIDALVMDVLTTAPGMDAKTLQELMFKASRRMTYWHRLMREQQVLFDAFRAAEIPFVILKGAAAACYYPQPEGRSMGDVDLIVYPEDFQRAYDFMLENGFALIHDPGTREAVLQKNGVTFELHRYYTLMDDKEKGRFFDDTILSELDHLQEGQIGEYRFPMLSKLTNGLVLLVHIDQHMAGGLGLRQIIDWMLFVDRELDDEWWYREFQPWVAKLGLEKLAVAVTRMCQMYLGLREEGITWCSGADETVCTKLMAVTMERGNFGKKNLESAGVVTVVNNISGIPSLFRRLHERGCRNWALVKKYPFLKAFAWIYQLFRYIRRGFGRKDAIKNLQTDIERSKQEGQIWDELEIARRRQ